MERFSLEYEYEEYIDPVVRAQELLDKKREALESQSLLHTVAETDGLTSLLHIMIQPGLPFL